MRPEAIRPFFAMYFAPSARVSTAFSLFLSGTRETALTPVRQMTPRFSRCMRNCMAMSLSSVGASWGAASAMMTRVPICMKKSAISTPTVPPPAIMRLSGMTRCCKMVVEPRIMRPSGVRFG